MTPFLFSGLGFAIGITAIAIGFLAMLFPKKMSEGFGIPADSTSLHYVKALGVRDIFVGLVVLLLTYYSQWIQLGYVCLAIAFVAASDFYTVFRYGQRRASIPHLAGLALSLIFAYLFLTSEL